MAWEIQTAHMVGFAHRQITVWTDGPSLHLATWGGIPTYTSMAGAAFMNRSSLHRAFCCLKVALASHTREGHPCMSGARLHSQREHPGTEVAHDMGNTSWDAACVLQQLQRNLFAGIIHLNLANNASPLAPVQLWVEVPEKYHLWLLAVVVCEYNAEMGFIQLVQQKFFGTIVLDECPTFGGLFTMKMPQCTFTDKKSHQPQLTLPALSELFARVALR